MSRVRQPRADRRGPHGIVVFTLVLLTWAAPELVFAQEDASRDNPTDPEARALFEESNALWTKSGRTRAEAERAAELMREVTEMEPEFALGHAYLANAEAWIYQSWDRSADRAAIAREASQAAMRLDPEAAASHGALATYFYRVEKDYEQAFRHYDHAAQRDPDSVYPLRMAGYVARRSGDFESAAERLEAARELSATRATEWELGNTYQRMGRYDDARKAYERARALQPDHNQPKVALAWLDANESGDYESVRAFHRATDGGYISNRWWVAMVDEDWEGALAAMDADGGDPLSGQTLLNPRALTRGLTYLRMGDEARARSAFEEARDMLAPMLEAEPDDLRLHHAMGRALAGLGQADEALAHARRGVEILPPEDDAMNAPATLLQLAEVQAMVGDTDGALATLEEVLGMPRPWGNAVIASDPWLYALQGDPRFEALLGTS